MFLIAITAFSIVISCQDLAPEGTKFMKALQAKAVEGDVPKFCLLDPYTPPPSLILGYSFAPNHV